MTNSSLSDNSSRQLQVRDFYLGRQPVLDRDQALFGYELLFRQMPGDPLAAGSAPSELASSATVIAHAAQLGLDRVIGDALGFVRADAAVLDSDIFAFLPREKVVLELTDSLPATPALLARISELKTHGFRFALTGVVADTEAVQAVLPLVEFIKLDVVDMPMSALTQLVPRLREQGKKLIANKVETHEHYQTCLALGMDYFQGYYFARPVIISGRKLSPSQLAIMDMMALVTSDADNAVIERAVKKDITLALNLLRLVNTPAVGARQKIESLTQAVTILGRRQLQRWLQIMLYAEPGRGGQSQTPLLMLATTRAKLLELLARRLKPSQRHLADVAFTVGIMSLMDTLFGMPMTAILEQIPVSDEIRSALLERSGFFGDLLRLAESIETMDETEEGQDEVMPALHQLDLSAGELVDLEVDAYTWSDSVVRFAI